MHFASPSPRQSSHSSFCPKEESKPKPQHHTQRSLQRATSNTMPGSYSSGSSTAISDIIVSSDINYNFQQMENVANQYLVQAYDLVWNQGDYEQALLILRRALDIQRSYLGKHHKDVGYTCNFIGTVFSLQGYDLNGAMRYFLEARRIFGKLMVFTQGEDDNDENDDDDDDDKDQDDIKMTTQLLLEGIDDRIHDILIKFQLPESEIKRAQNAIDQFLVHELHGDRLKSQGYKEAAREEHRRAKRVVGILRQLI